MDLKCLKQCPNMNYHYPKCLVWGSAGDLADLMGHLQSLGSLLFWNCLSNRHYSHKWLSWCIGKKIRQGIREVHSNFSSATSPAQLENFNTLPGAHKTFVIVERSKEWSLLHAGNRLVVFQIGGEVGFLEWNVSKPLLPQIKTCIFQSGSEEASSSSGGLICFWVICLGREVLFIDL